MAPAEIKGDVEVIADTFERVVTAVSTAGFQLDQVDASTLQELQSENFLDGVARLQAYLSSVCRTGG